MLRKGGIAEVLRVRHRPHMGIAQGSKTSVNHMHTNTGNTRMRSTKKLAAHVKPIKS
jgi:hypothetical protein